MFAPEPYVSVCQPVHRFEAKKENEPEPLHEEDEQDENPDEVILDRQNNRHVAFGSGIHRCAGSNLARLEVRIALQTWLERIPEFELVDPTTVTWAGGQVHGPRSCMVKF